MTRTALVTAALLALSPAAFAESMPSEALLMLDSDGNKVVTFEEFSGMMTTLYGGMDTNHNGRLERAETESYMSKEVFDAADANRNGNLSKSEFDAQVRKDFDTADKDGDGALD